MHSAEVIYIMEMCNAFMKSGTKVILVIPEIDRPIEDLFRYYRVEYPFEVRQIKLPKVLANSVIPGRGVFFTLLSAAEIFRLAKEHTVYSRDPWVFALLSMCTDKCCFLDIHQFRFHSALQTFIFRSIIKQGMKRGNARMICISGSLMNQWEEYGVQPDKMVVAHDAANLKYYRCGLTKEEARKELGLGTDKPVVVYTGSLMPSKGVDVLIRCANRLPEVSFVVVGGEKVEIEELRKIASNDNVIFTGHCPPEVVPVYQTAADILALPNTRGSVIDDVTSPMKLFEYIAAERPIIASDMPTLVEILEDGKNALISPAGDDYQLSRNIERLLADPATGERLVVNARKELSKYTWDNRVTRIRSLFPRQEIR